MHSAVFLWMFLWIYAPVCLSFPQWLLDPLANFHQIWQCQLRLRGTGSNRFKQVTRQREKPLEFPCKGKTAVWLPLLNTKNAHKNSPLRQTCRKKRFHQSHIEWNSLLLIIMCMLMSVSSYVQHKYWNHMLFKYGLCLQAWELQICISSNLVNFVRALAPLYGAYCWQSGTKIMSESFLGIASGK